MRDVFKQAVARHQAGQLEAAARSYQKVLKVSPSHAEARHLFGILRFQQGKHDEAIKLLRAVLRDKPDYPEALYNLGNIYSQLHRYAEALEIYERALAINPDLGEAHANRGNALLELRRYPDALESFDRALAINPTMVTVLNNRGTALRLLKRFDEAVQSYDRALALRPNFVEAHISKADAFNESGRYAQALAAYEKILAFQPGNRMALRGRADAALNLCDWKRTREIDAHLDQQVAGISPWTLLCYRDDPERQRKCSESYVQERLLVLPAPLPVRRKWDDKITIAYLSNDLRQHPVAYLMAELFEAHHRDRFRVLAFSYGPDDGSAMRRRLETAFDEFHDVRNMTDADVARLIHERGIGIAVDAMGYTRDGRPGILASRPAPVQASYLGYTGTLGTSYVDYLIGDHVVTPPEDEQHYSEKIVRLPDCYLVTDRKREIAPQAPTRREAGLPDGGFVFCCFNSIHKIRPEFFEVWMRLLQAVAGSVLWLLAGPAEAQANILREAQTRGVDPARVIFAPWVNPENHLARHALADLFLDTLPYNAHTTATDALWVGLPLLTCPGRSFPARVASSVLSALNMPELIAQSLDDYEARALQWARDPASLAAVRRKLAANRDTTPMFDTDRFVGHIEAAYAQMWDTFRRGEKPRSFNIPSTA